MTAGRKYNYYTYDNEVDNYQQDHYQLHFNHSFNNDLNLVQQLITQEEEVILSSTKLMKFLKTMVLHQLFYQVIQ